MRKQGLAALGAALLAGTLFIAPLRPAEAQKQTAAAAAATPAAANTTAKKPITHDVYDSWRSIQGTRLSRDGAWVAYTLAPQDGDGELIVQSLNGSGGRLYQQARGRAPVITADSKFVVFGIAPRKADLDRAKKEKKPPADQPKPGMGILDLTTGKVVTVERVREFSLSEDGSRYVAYLLDAPKAAAAATPPKTSSPEPALKPQTQEEPQQARPRRAREGARRIAAATGTAAAPPKKKDPGSDLVIRELATDAITVIPEVSDFTWNKPGTWLAYAVSSKTPKGDGAFLRQPEKEAVPLPLLTGAGHYKTLVFNEKGDQVAFLSDRDDYKAETPVFTAYHCRVEGGKDEATAFASARTAGMPPGHVVSDSAGLRFSKDGERLFLGVTPAPTPKAKDAPDPVNVDIWSWKDPFLQPMQKVRAASDRRHSLVAVWHVKNKKLIALGSPEVPDINIRVEAERYLVGVSDQRYRQLVSWDRGYNDVFIVDMRDGARRRLLEKQGGSVSVSPGEKYLIYWTIEGNAWRVQDIAGKKPPVNLTGSLGVSFADERNDRPAAPSSYGVPGWTENDETVLIYDRYDLWEIRPDGSRPPRRVTRGRESGLVFRYASLDPDERTIPTDKPLLLSVTNDRTKATGYYRLAALKQENAVPQKLVMLDKRFFAFQKAKEADTVLFTLSRFEEYPNLHVSRLPDLTDIRKISDANPQQSRYIWGKSELIEYKNADGKTLQAVLTRPENFDPTKKYPLLVYIYETMSQNLHSYSSPGPGTSINVPRYVSNGYIVLRPDIVYTPGYPGESAMKCVLPAIQEVVQRGYIDTARIGIQGHSWGGYQITYLVTRTNLFRAVSAGASVANMVSAYGGIRWGTGMSRAFQYERDQSRIGGAPWEKPLQFIENSPVFWADKVQTPYLTIHNDADGAVPWYQGIEFFTALRRLGKEAYLFNYNGEDHNLISRENQKHWSVHMAEFFDHHLLGAPRPDWMEKGVPYLDRGTRDLRTVFGTAPNPPAESPEGQPPPPVQAEGAKEEKKIGAE